ncbi:tripartite tricarboxylate transporter TctB family protein [Vreelandella glaciei]|uniref:tripartite tricarboxylate transporter TctB family protein n=1 Tax=Vreelandella glaciei TaxID=186761 RepID=UPI003003257D
MNVSRLVLGVFAIGLAATFYIAALGYPDKAANMPLIYSVVVALLGLAMVAQEILPTLRHRQVVVEKSSAVADADEQTSRRRPWKAMLIFVLAGLYLYSISVLGYLIATVGFMVIALGIVGHVSWRFAAMGIVALVTVVCAVFISFLGLPVPLLPPLFS